MNNTYDKDNFDKIMTEKIDKFAIMVDEIKKQLDDVLKFRAEIIDMIEYGESEGIITKQEQISAIKTKLEI